MILLVSCISVSAFAVEDLKMDGSYVIETMEYNNEKYVLKKLLGKQLMDSHLYRFPVFTYWLNEDGKFVLDDTSEELSWKPERFIIRDIVSYCQKKAGELEKIEFNGVLIQVCREEYYYSNGDFNIKWKAAGVPFGRIKSKAKAFGIDVSFQTNSFYIAK